MGFLTNWLSSLGSPEGGWSSLTPHMAREQVITPPIINMHRNHIVAKTSLSTQNLVICGSDLCLISPKSKSEPIVYSYRNRQVTKGSWHEFVLMWVHPAELEPGKAVCLTADRIYKIVTCNAEGSIWTLTLAVSFNSFPEMQTSQASFWLEKRLSTAKRGGGNLLLLSYDPTCVTFPMP